MPLDRYTQEATATILASIRDGIPVSVAVRQAGIARSTFYKWLQDHPEFNHEVTKAEGDRQAALIRELRASGREDWRAHSWQLERTVEEFRESKDVRVHVEKGVQQALEAIRDRISASAWEEVVSAFADLQGLDGDAASGAPGDGA